MKILNNKYERDRKRKKEREKEREREGAGGGGGAYGVSSYSRIDNRTEETK